MQLQYATITLVVSFVCPYVRLSAQYKATSTAPIFVTLRNEYMY